MNKKHTFKVGKYISMACLLFVCATVQSCRDEYFYDDREPDWLGESIYEYLESKGNFTLFMKVIEDLKLKEVLSKTGSKTLFVADDAAFIKGIQEEWGFTSYEELTPAHKRIILNNAMLDNAYLLELMSSMPASGANAEPVIGRCLRQLTSANVVDTIGYFYDADLPQNNEHWDRFRETGIRLALDATEPMMVHFLEEQLYQNSITAEDVSFLLNNRYDNVTLKDAFIFDKKVIDQNVTCKNGYVHQLDGLLIPPSNMAEEIRKNDSTSIYSRMLDRFAVPVPNVTLTAKYNEYLGNENNTEKVYEKRYWTKGSNRGVATAPESGFVSYLDAFNDNKEYIAKDNAALFFSPGWNEYRPGASSTTVKENDMAIMFAPSDPALKTYFTAGEGQALIERYGKNAKLKGYQLETLTDAELIEDIDSIPLKDLQYLLRNMMKNSFNAAVPSRFESIMDDARDPMKVKKEHVDKVIIANNGVIYVTNQVYSPARYVAVTAPVMLSDTLKISNWAINSYEYDKYLLSMGSTFSLIVPSDGCIRYLNPKTINTDTPIMYIFKWDTAAKNEAARVYAEIWTCDPNTMEPIEHEQGDNLNPGDLLKNLLQQMFEYYIIVGDVCEVPKMYMGMKPNKYHMAKGYGTVKVEHEETGEPWPNEYKVSKVMGGYEVQNGTNVPMGHIYPQKNGNTYRLDEGMILPPTQSVYKVMSDDKNHPEFSKFFELCEGNPIVSNSIKETLIIMKEDMKTFTGSDKEYAAWVAATIDTISLPYAESPLIAGIKNDINLVCNKTVKSDDAIAPDKYIERYNIFERPTNAGLDLNVRTFDTYHYTVYVPQNDDIIEAYNQGLPQWIDLEDKANEIDAWRAVLADQKFVLDSLKSEELITPEDEEIMKADIAALTYKIYSSTVGLILESKVITNFVKYHFQDNSVYVDNLPHYIMEGDDVKTVVDYETATLDEATRRFCTVRVRTHDNTIAVCGDFGEEEDEALESHYNKCRVITDGIEGQHYNIMTRDIEFKGSQIYSSSYAVMHQIEGFLVNDRIYDAETQTFIK